MAFDRYFGAGRMWLESAVHDYRMFQCWSLQRGCWNSGKLQVYPAPKRNMLTGTIQK